MTFSLRSQVGRITASCAHCRTDVEVTPEQFNGTRVIAVYCSAKCQLEAKAVRRTLAGLRCDVCGEGDEENPVQYEGTLKASLCSWCSGLLWHACARKVRYADAAEAQGNADLHQGAAVVVECEICLGWHITSNITFEPPPGWAERLALLVAHYGGKPTWHERTAALRRKESIVGGARRQAPLSGPPSIAGP